MKVLFLDIDGVLNGHDWHEGARSNTLRRDCVDQLSRILMSTQCKIVLSSAWRYLIHSKQMTMKGFACMLRTHGTCGIATAIIGVTRRDEDCSHCGHKHRRGRRRRWSDHGYFICWECGKPSHRGDQIACWLQEHPEVTRRMAIDDEDWGITERGIPLWRTNGAHGLTKYGADRVIRHLGREDC